MGEGKKKKKFPMTKIVLKLNKFHACAGCWLKVKNILSETKGIETKLIDKQKCLLTITGTMDTGVMVAKLAKMRKDHEVEIVHQDGGKREEEEVANTKNSSTDKPSEEFETKSSSKEKNSSEEVDTKSSPEEKPNEKTEETSSSAEKPKETIPSSPNEVERTKPTREHRLEYGATPGYDCGNGSNYGPSYAYGNGPYNYPQGYAYSSGSDNDGKPHAAQYAINEEKDDRSPCSIM